MFDQPLDSIRIFDIKLMNSGDFSEMLFRLAINLAVTLFIALKIYFPNNPKREYVFTFVLFNSIIFFLCFLLSSVKLSIGFAFGLFAVFSILRYRTLPISIRDMTYLFIIIGIAVFNSISTKKVSITELLFTNAMLLMLTWYFETKWLSSGLTNKIITYDNNELIKPINQAAFLKDISDRTGLDVQKAEVEKIDLLRETAQVRIYYPQKS